MKLTEELIQLIAQELAEDAMWALSEAEQRAFAGMNEQQKKAFIDAFFSAIVGEVKDREEESSLQS